MFNAQKKATTYSCYDVYKPTSTAFLLAKNYLNKYNMVNYPGWWFGTFFIVP